MWKNAKTFTRLYTMVTWGSNWFHLNPVAMFDIILFIYSFVLGFFFVFLFGFFIHNVKPKKSLFNDLCLKEKYKLFFKDRVNEP